MRVNQIALILIMTLTGVGCGKTKDDPSKTLPRSTIQVASADSDTVHKEAFPSMDISIILDLNGDGLNDILMASSDKVPVLGSLQQSADGNFEEVQQKVYFKMTTDIVAVYEISLNDDNYGDVIVVQDGGFLTYMTSDSKGELTVIRREDPEVFTDMWVHATEKIEENGKLIFFWAYEDVINGGVVLFKYTQESANSDSFLRETIQIDFKEFVSSKGGGVPLGGIDEIRVGFLNRDSYVDIALLDMSENRIYSLLSENGEDFKVASYIADPYKPYSIQLLKLNEDETSDLFVSHTFPKREFALASYLYYSDGNGSFIESSRQEILTGVQCLSAKTGEFLQSGRRRLVVASSNNGGLFFYDLTAGGVVSPIPQEKLSPDGYPAMFDVGDLNGDGILDIVTANEKSRRGSVSLFLSKIQ